MLSHAGPILDAKITHDSDNVSLQENAAFFYFANRLLHFYLFLLETFSISASLAASLQMLDI